MHKATLLLFIGVFAMIMLSFTEAGKNINPRTALGRRWTRKWNWIAVWTYAITVDIFAFFCVSLLLRFAHTTYTIITFFNHVLNSLCIASVKSKVATKVKGNSKAAARRAALAAAKEQLAQFEDRAAAKAFVKAQVEAKTQAKTEAIRAKRESAWTYDDQ